MTEPDDALDARLSLLVPVNKLTPSHRAELMHSATLIPFRKRELIFRQGERDDFCFYLLEGELELTADDQLIKRVVGGDGASYQPLSQLQPRKMTARAVSDGRALRVERSLLDRLLTLSLDGAATEPEDIEVEEIETDADRDWLMTMLRSELFSRLPPSHIQKLLDTLEPVEVTVGEYVVRQGEPGDYYYAIQAGRCEVLRRSGTGDRQIRLAELGPGDTFGEEALISGAKRNASVRMVTDGALARLSKAHFADLIKRPVLKTVAANDAKRQADAGAVLVDVRYPEEFAANGLPGAINVPLHLIRTRYREFDPARAYVAYCDTGGRSSIASFLLTEQGIDCAYVDGGWIAEEIPPGPHAESESAAAPEPAEAAGAEPDPEVAAREATAAAATLTARLAEANRRFEQAQRMMEEAERAKAQAEIIVAEQLAAERESVNAEAERARRTLAEAERLKSEIEPEQREAVRVAELKQAALERELSEVKADAERRLKEKEAELEAIYARSTAELERLQAENLDTTQELVAEYERVMETARLKDEETKRLKDELAAAEDRRVRDLQTQERELKDRLQSELMRERRRLEAELGRLAEELERTRAAEEAALAAKEAAAAEAERVVEEYAKTQDEVRRQEQERLAEEREAIETEAERIRAELTLALKAKAEAEAAKRAADTELETLRVKLAEALKADAESEELARELKAAIARSEALAVSASERVNAAREAHAYVRSAQERNVAALEQTYHSEAEINQVLQRELEEWVVEQEARRAARTSDPTERDEELMRRTAAKARQKKAEAEAHVQSLFDDLRNFDT